MSPSTQYAQDYQQAVSAYMNGGYSEAAAMADRLVANHPNDPHLRLLRGHIYCCQQQYETAREQYQLVLSLTTDPELINCATASLAETDQFSAANSSSDGRGAAPDWDSEEVTALKVDPVVPVTSMRVVDLPEELRPSTPPNPFATISEEFEFPSDAELRGEFDDGIGAEVAANNSPVSLSDLEALPTTPYGENHDSHQDDLPPDAELWQGSSAMLPEPEPSTNPPDSIALEDSSEDSLFGDYFSMDVMTWDSPQEPQFPSAALEMNEQTQLLGLEEQSLPSDRWFNNDNETFAGISPLAAQASDISLNLLSANLNQDLHQDLTLGSTETFGLPPSSLETGLTAANVSWSQANPSYGRPSMASAATTRSSSPSSGEFPQDLSLFATQSEAPARVATSVTPGQAAEEVVLESQSHQTSLSKQNLITAVTAGVLSTLVAGTISLGMPGQKNLAAAGLASLAAGVVAGGTVLVMGQNQLARIKRSTTDLQTQLNTVIRGDLNTKATVFSQDEFGQLASSFNKMTRVIYAITSEAQRKAEENEKSKEDLQRQVIRLLDDVEGAARGDLTVQAEVTADVLGAVADSFNLTIHNLQKIVRQVKLASHQVSQGATENESFARSLSTDASRQAEELAVTLNSVQMMTSAIQRVAESAKEANAVARNASATALKGGESVERTVAAILQIRETVAETTRKVKRLAESSQEISKIVSLISQIASRTNLLALNASIEAARAGEAGRGFAIVADEVRQLADRAAKSSKEIEQIVLQIQSETGSVMTAMEEGTQQVIQGTRVAEQAKRSLEDIIQVSGLIDGLVRAITSSTIEQTETARSMARVMQSVELTAQATSQEAQRVSNSLQNLVGVAQDLETSVEKFKVETSESDLNR